MPPEEEPKLPSLPHDFGDPETFLPGTPWWHYALMVLGAVVLLAIILIPLIRRLRKPKMVTLPPEDYLAKAHLKLDDMDQQRPTGEVATECSLILRECLHKIYGEPVLFETDEEIKLRPDSLAKVPNPLRTGLVQLLEQLGEEKYAPSQVSESKAESWLKRCKKALNELKGSLETSVQQPETSR